MMFSHIPFPIWTAILGVLCILPGVFALAMPGPAALAAREIPRNGLLGKVLSALAFIWAGLLLYRYPFDFVVRIRHYIPFAILVAIPMSWYSMPRLLAARSLGGLFALLPAPVLIASRTTDNPLRLVVVVFVYLVAVYGMALIMSPYYLRDHLAWFAARPARLRAAGAVSCAFGVLLLALALIAFR